MSLQDDGREYQLPLTLSGRRGTTEQLTVTFNDGSGFNIEAYDAEGKVAESCLALFKAYLLEYHGDLDGLPGSSEEGESTWDQPLMGCGLCAELAVVEALLPDEGNVSLCLNCAIRYLNS